MIVAGSASADPVPPGTGDGFYDGAGSISIEVNQVAAWAVFIGDDNHLGITTLGLLSKDPGGPEFTGIGFGEDAVDTLDRFGELSLQNNLTKAMWDTLVNVDVAGLAASGAKLWLKTVQTGHPAEYVELIPEPGALAVLALGACGVLLRRRRRALKTM
jgi:hypothetical protein